MHLNGASWNESVSLSPYIHMILKFSFSTVCIISTNKNLKVNHLKASSDISKIK